MRAFRRKLTFRQAGIEGKYRRVGLLYYWKATIRKVDERKLIDMLLLIINENTELRLGGVGHTGFDENGIGEAGP